MKAVSNTTPLRYLIAIGQEHLLGKLFEKVFVPIAVHEELTDAKTPETVRRRVGSLPAWFEVRAVEETRTATFPVTLHRGERQAILLAEAVRADLLLIDEQVGRTIALGRNTPLSMLPNSCLMACEVVGSLSSRRMSPAPFRAQ
jgi:predicted nucleic acid-binding protein